ncbi:MFS Git1p-related glycerophosphoinositol and glycerophosphocholine permease [Cantharellus anzutake]|uniref:MFS Git1p-related glycerophosphoinositol and glycerophosphocholine permease n=1 Tax=Cantharellus anzutake TaxID=1750568 RepID=UPI001906EAFE|nr:MFS Git1p-related glycerophosphoinositol and glycerophosphocholine permease [Cantharellus anzutake]KAF8339919.1 MFS Git1p-related glycerophosphoinositol and glycerophosphocholine permease [Cantharellus anzutake]
MSTNLVQAAQAQAAKRGRLSQVSLIFACGTALFSDVIGSVNTILGLLYPKGFKQHPKYSRTLSSLTFAGTVAGMLIFGYLSDKVGRKFGMMAATVIVVIFSALSAASYGAGDTFSGLITSLSAYRFLLGIGVGAEYPCGSVAASEQSEGQGIAKNAQHRWFALATNSMIDFGFVIAAFVPLVLLWIFGLNHLRVVWRLSLGLGVIPASIVFVWRLKMVESTRYQKDSMKHVQLPYWLIFRRYWPSLIAISVTWFIYDFITYPFGLYSSTILLGVLGKDPSLYKSFGWNVVINLFYMPGTLIGAFVVDYLGPKNTMIFGLLAQAAIGFIMSGAYIPLQRHVAAFAVVYGIFLSFGELGPGNCLGLLASKMGPTAARGHIYGIAAAVGKVGAFVGIWVFPPMITAFSHHGKDPNRGYTGPFWVGSGLAVLSAIITFLLIKPLSHDGMEAEDLAFREYLEAHGWDTSQRALEVTSESEVASIEEKHIAVEETKV